MAKEKNSPPADYFGRHSWDEYLMAMAFVASSRSLDPETKHGCVIVDKERTILSMGYNSPPRGTNDKNVPLTRPEKYPYFCHAEEAAIANAARNGVALKGSVAVVTGDPCGPCLRMLLNAGVIEFVIGGVKSACVNEEMDRARQVLLEGRRDVIYRRFEPADLTVLDSTLHYFQKKCGVSR